MKIVDHLLTLYGEFDRQELEASLRAYKADLEKEENAPWRIRVPDHEYYEVRTVLSDRMIGFTEVVTVQYEMRRRNMPEQNTRMTADDVYVVPEAWIKNYWEVNRLTLPTRAESFEEYMQKYEPEKDGELIYEVLLGELLGRA